MKGFYSIWSAPGKEEYSMEDFELCTMVLSAYMWRKIHGSILLFADQKALAYLKGKDLLEIFDDGYEELLVDSCIAPKVFWAAGKIYALSQLKEPRAMIDLDLIVWENLEEEFAKGDIYVIHRENVHNSIYPEKEFFQMDQEYEFPSDLNWDAPACNTALLYIRDMEFLKRYTEESISFMKHSTEQEENLCHMVFAEQRLLSALAEGSKCKQSIYSAYPLAENILQQNTFTHVWGHKNILRFNYKERQEYCRRCLRRLKLEFPAVYEKLIKLPELQEYKEDKED